MYFALHKFLLRTAGTGGADAPAGAVAVAGQVCSESLRYRAFGTFPTIKGSGKPVLLCRAFRESAVGTDTPQDAT